MDTLSQPALKRIFIENILPPELDQLQKLSHNLWWTWNPEAIRLFKDLRPDGLEKAEYNPIVLLNSLTREEAQHLIQDADFMGRMQAVYQDFEVYLSTTAPIDQPLIGYFCMEYGLHYSLRLYSGGLGILAGDYLKQASDSNVNMIGVGLLYRYGYFQQSISLYGDQISEFHPQQFSKLPVFPVRNAEGEWIKTSANLRGEQVVIRIWELKVGRISLYLLDTDTSENSQHARTLTHKLYGGDNEHRLMQEILLGIGGVRALDAIGIEPSLFHCNEGHAALLGVERIRKYVQQDLSYEEALEVVRASSLFTTHTPVPAGHDHFSDDLLKRYMEPILSLAGFSFGDFLAMGKLHPNDPSELFSMSHLAIRMSQEVNGVSRLHGAVSREMFQELYPGYTVDELHIGHVTNGVHYPTWIAPEWRELFLEQFGSNFEGDQSNPEYWKRIQRVSSNWIFELRTKLKRRLLDYVQKQLKADLTRRGEKPATIFEMVNGIQYDALVIGFARRFATYKRAHLLFSNLERLSEIVNSEDRPVIFLYAGKAHPADEGGQHLIRQIVQLSKSPDFVGKVIFLEGYNMEMAKLLVQGVDIWLNTPTRPLEASGTSGMKAAMNGVMNFSVLDGWWDEAYNPRVGWALTRDRTYEDQELQNELDAESIYNILENEIIPTYYDRDGSGIPKDWVGYIKNIIDEVAPTFTMKRMLDDYYDKFYDKLAARSKVLQADHYAQAKAFVSWRREMIEKWKRLGFDRVEVLNPTSGNTLRPDLPFHAKLQVALGSIQREYVGVEAVFYRRDPNGKLHLVKQEPFTFLEEHAGSATYELSLPLKLSGAFEYGFRLYCKHPLLPNRQDLNLVHWMR